MNFGPVTPEFKKVECAVFVATRPHFDDTPSYDLHMHTGIRKRIGISQFKFQQITQQSYIVYKFGEICFSDPGVDGLRMCTVAVEYFIELF